MLKQTIYLSSYVIIMTQKFELRKQTSEPDQSIKILCLGEEEVGKSTFLSQQIQQESFSHVKDSPCQVFLKRYISSLNRQVWVEFYELSNTYPEYLGCYMQEAYEAAIFFYDMTDKRSRNRLYIWMRLLQQYKKDQIWNIPVLIVGLKRNLIFVQQLEQLTKDVESQFSGIFRPKSFLTFGQSTGRQQQSMIQLQLFIRRIISRRFGESSQWEKYKLIRSYKIYQHMYSYYELSCEGLNILKVKIAQTIQSMNLRGILQKASDVYLRFTDKLSTY